MVLHAQETAVAKARTVLDSLNTWASKQWLTDSLSIHAWGDSLKSGIESKVNRKVQQLDSEIDSLQALQLPIEKYTKQIDSIRQKQTQLMAEVNEKSLGLMNKAKGNIEQWQSKLKTDFGLEKLNLPAAELPQLNLPTDFNIPKLGVPEFQSLNLSPDLASINSKLPFNSFDGLKEWQGKLGGLQDFKSIKSNPDKAIENALTKIDGVNELEDKLNVGGLENSEAGKILQNAKNPEALKQTAMEEVKKEAINHFAGKEQVLQSAMEQVSKYKQKYSSVGSLSEIQNMKRPPNPLKGKPFIERLVPGIAIQIHSKHYLNFDFNPYAGYKITPKFTAGLGWNQRFAMEWSTKTFKHDGRVFGPRTFVEYNLPRGFCIRLEGEWLNSLVPSNAVGKDASRQWVFSTMTGLKKDYRFFKKVKGFTIVQFDLVRLIKPNNNSPYADVVNTRFGFEFPLKKKKITKAD